MSKKFYILVLLSAVACSGGTGSAGARTAAATPAIHTETRAPVVKSAVRTANAPLEYRDETEHYRLFIENAERAIGQYSEFIARAGQSQEYAPAVKRSREQIEDLLAAIAFVRAGAEQRQPH